MWRPACLLWLACARGWPHMDSRDSAFPYGYQPTEQERKMVAPNEMTGVFMGGRHSVDGNEPDVQRLAQWSMSHVDECLHAQFPRFQKVTLSRVLKAEKQLMTVLDCRYFLTIEATVREPPAEPAAGMVDDGAVPPEQLAVLSLTINRNLHDNPYMGVCKARRPRRVARASHAPLRHATPPRRATIRAEPPRRAARRCCIGRSSSRVRRAAR